MDPSCKILLNVTLFPREDVIVSTETITLLNWTIKWVYVVLGNIGWSEIQIGWSGGSTNVIVVKTFENDSPEFDCKLLNVNIAVDTFGFMGIFQWNIKCVFCFHIK